MYSDLVAFWPHLYYIIKGTGVTLQYSIVSVCFGMIIGTLLAICKTADSKLLRIFAVSYTSVFRGTPMLVQLTIIHYGLPSLLGIKISIFVSGVVAFSLNSGAYVSEIIKAGIKGIDKGQIEAAKALGIPPVLRMKDIILPQALRNILPALVNELINLINALLTNKQSKEMNELLEPCESLTFMVDKYSIFNDDLKMKLNELFSF